MRPAIALLEFDSVARGIQAGDAMAKRAPIDVLRVGTVHPGRFLVLVGGATADVEEALDEGRAVGQGAILDEVYLPDVHPDVVAALGGARRGGEGAEALGVIETATVATAIHAADAGAKGAEVAVRELRLADDVGGRGYVLFSGTVSEVEAAVSSGVDRIAGSGQEVAHVVIASLHREMDDELRDGPEFRQRVRGATKASDGGPGGGIPAGGYGSPRPLPGTGGVRAAPSQPSPPREPVEPVAATPRARRARKRT